MHNNKVHLYMAPGPVYYSSLHQFGGPWPEKRWRPLHHTIMWNFIGWKRPYHASLKGRSDRTRWTQMEWQLYIENQCKWRDDKRFKRRRRVWSSASEAMRIKLKISNFSGGIAPRHPISDEFKLTTSLPSRTVVYGRPEQHGGEADSSCLWAPGAVWHHCSVLQGQTEKKRRRGWKSMWKKRVEKYRFKKWAGKCVVFLLKRSEWCE